MALPGTPLPALSRFAGLLTVGLALAPPACVEAEQHGAVLEADVRSADPLLPLVPLDQRARVAEADTLFHLLLDHDVVVVAHSPVVAGRVASNAMTSSEDPSELVRDEYVDVQVDVDRFLVGAPRDDLAFAVYCSDEGESCERIARLVDTPNERVTIFLDEVPRFGGGTELFLDAYTPGVVRADVDEDRARAFVELLDDADERMNAVRCDPVIAAVDEQIDRISDGPAAQYDAMRALLVLGKRAIPAIARRLDDFRPLPSDLIMLVNPPEFFEAFATYGISEVADALIVVLAELSVNGPHCEGILDTSEDHTSDDLRRNCIARWRVWTLRGIDEGAFGPEWHTTR